MEEPRPDAPEMELTADRQGPVDDALRLGDGDTVPSAGIDDAFAMHLDAAEPAAEPLPAKPSKPVTAEANASVVAALMGKPIAKPAPKAKPAAVSTAVPREVPPSPPERAEDRSTATAAASQSHLPTDAGVALADVATEPILESRPEPFEITTLTSIALDTPAPAFAAEGSVGGVSIGGLPAATFDVALPPPATVEVPPPVVESPTPAVASTVVVDAIVPVLARALPTTLPKSERPDRPPARGTPVAPAWTGETPSEPAPAPPPKRRPARPKPVVALKAEPPAVAHAEPAAEYAAALAVPPGRTGAWWTIPFTVVGIAIVACAVLVPAAEDARRDTYELAKIERDVDYFQRQSEVNADFLERVNTDATLAERLAMRQLHQMRPNTRLAQMSATDHYGASPYAMTRLDPPAPLPPYRPTPGKLTEWFVGDKRPQQMAALGLLTAGLGVMFGGVPRKRVG